MDSRDSFCPVQSIKLATKQKSVRESYVKLCFYIWLRISLQLSEWILLDSELYYSDIKDKFC